MYKVQEVAKIAGVSVRTLHHYDSIGLMKPSNIGSNRYRYYNDEDLKLLQNILFFKELGFPLKKIQEIAAQGLDEHYALTQHIKFLEMKKARLEKLIENAELTQREYEGQETLTNDQRFSAFSAKQVDENIKQYIKPVDPHEEAAELEKPGETSTVELSNGDDFAASNDTNEEENFTEAANDFESAEPSETQEDRFTEEAVENIEPEKEEEDLDEINREGNRIYNAVSNLMHLPPESAEVQQEMYAYYSLLNRFYNCNPKMFRGLGDLYANDSRFADNIDQHGEGLSKYLKDAMYVYAEKVENA
ncbi:MAG TPA: MerR family transcriptional regulator [Planococcus sp. (in: firmicutes)]|nr:MerR family transcriptional regulator [Planococcus sp. (in: firmicutes)]